MTTGFLSTLISVAKTENSSQRTSQTSRAVSSTRDSSAPPKTIVILSNRGGFFIPAPLERTKKRKRQRQSRCLFCLGWKRFYHFSQGKFTGNQLLVLAQATLMTGSSV